LTASAVNAAAKPGIASAQITANTTRAITAQLTIRLRYTLRRSARS